MKREELLKVFPSLSEKGIQALPSELVICWYPSSGAGSNQDIVRNDCAGYHAVKHWREQPSNLKPNFFIFSDLMEFERPLNFNLIFTIELNIEKVIYKGSDLIVEKKTFDGTLLEGCDEIFFGDQEVIEKKEVLTLKHLTLLENKGLFFLLVQTENEFIYSSFIEENINIPLLTLNRPMDPFIFDNGIDIKKLGIKEFIAGRGYVISLLFGDEFFKYPDFVFQIIRNEDSEHKDIANLYSLKY